MSFKSSLSLPFATFSRLRLRLCDTERAPRPSRKCFVSREVQHQHTQHAKMPTTSTMSAQMISSIVLQSNLPTSPPPNIFTHSRSTFPGDSSTVVLGELGTAVEVYTVVGRIVAVGLIVE